MNGLFAVSEFSCYQIQKDEIIFLYLKCDFCKKTSMAQCLYPTKPLLHL